LPAGHWEIALTETLLREIYTATGRDVEAESLLVNGYEVVRREQPEESRHRRDARERVVEFFLWRGGPKVGALQRGRSFTHSLHKPYRIPTPGDCGRPRRCLRFEGRARRRRSMGKGYGTCDSCVTAWPRDDRAVPC
jgi:hypothetical protein